MANKNELSPGRALRPEVRMNKEQEEALGVTHCDNCGGTDDVRTVYYDAMVDGPGLAMIEDRCVECRRVKQ